ncbi:MAG: amidohydrolase family protein [Anaerolineae bacterium]
MTTSPTNNQTNYESSAELSPNLVIRNGLIVTTERQFEADIRIRDGRIVEIDRHLPRREGDERELDAQGLLVLPGGIDPHVHLTLPESVPAADRWVDDLTSGSKAALAGGITTVGNMSFPEPGETPLATLKRETKLVQQQAIADVMLHPVLLPPIEAAIPGLPQMVAAGHTTIKVFLCTEEFDKHVLAYLEMLQAAGEMGILTVIHCEDWAIISAKCQALLAQGHGSLRYYAESRPVVSEVVATQRAVAMCEATGSPIYVVHLSSERALRVCEEAQARALPVYVETRPLYLHLTQERFLDPDGAVYVGQPPLRETQDVAALWEGLGKGTIHTVATDHAPWTREQKLDPSLNVANLRPGVSNLQVMLPMLYSDGVLKGKISLGQFVALTSTNAARLFGLYPRKGTIAVGSDADLVLWDPTESRVIRGAEQFSRAGFSIYEGMEVTGWPRITIRRGQVVYEDGRIIAQPGSGQLVQCGRLQRLNN